jgi:hypothetical protein
MSGWAIAGTSENYKAEYSSSSWQRWRHLPWTTTKAAADNSHCFIVLVVAIVNRC